MRYKMFVLALLLSIIGCRQSSNVIAPVTQPPSSVSDSLDGILYTFSVSKDTLGILDTLDMRLTGLNQTAAPETLAVGDPLYTWSLTDGNGKIIASGPTVISNLISLVVLNPNQSALLYSIKYSMADIFGAPIQAGSYLLRWNLRNGLSLHLSLLCGKSQNEITDSSGITSSIYPLEVGNKWTFIESYLSPDGTVFGADTVTQTIVGETLINNEKWFLLKSTTLVDQLITSRQDGIYEYYSNIKAAVLKYKYPTVMGDQYTSGYEEWTGSSDTLVTFTATVDSTQEPIRVPAGRYLCNKYHAPEVLATSGNTTTEVDPEDIYLSNVGPVERIFYAGNDKPCYFWELIATNF